MPTSFTVVPVKNGAKKDSEEEDVDDNNVLKEEDEEAAGEIRFYTLTQSCAMVL